MEARGRTFSPLAARSRRTPRPPRSLQLLPRTAVVREQRVLDTIPRTTDPNAPPPPPPQRPAPPSGTPRAAGARAEPAAAASAAADVGAGDATAYWQYVHRLTTRNDLGHVCRECREPFTRLGEEMAERRGARLALRYHIGCFSGLADPRSQPRCPYREGKWAGRGLLSAQAPPEPFHKMRTATHFAGRGASRPVGANGLRPSV